MIVQVDIVLNRTNQVNNQSLIAELSCAKRGTMGKDMW